MKFNRAELIEDLCHRTEKAIADVNKFKSLSTDQLNYRESSEHWSILECIEHLNLYGDFYLPEIENKIIEQHPAPHAIIFKSGLIGNYFANLMKVKQDGGIVKMKSPLDKNPLHSSLSATTLERFLKQQERLLALLEQSKRMDLTGTKVSISLTRFIKLRLGDTLRFYVYHIERHIIQAKKVAKISTERLLRD